MIDCGLRESVLRLDSFQLITDVNKEHILLSQSGSQGAQRQMCLSEDRAPKYLFAIGDESRHEYADDLT